MDRRRLFTEINCWCNYTAISIGILFSLLILTFNKGYAEKLVSESNKSIVQDTEKSITVSFEDTGLSATDLERQIAIPAENILKDLSGLKNILSICKEDNLKIILKFYEDVDLAEVYLEVIEKTERLQDNLPLDINKPIVYTWPPIYNKPFLKITISNDDIEKLKIIQKEIIANILKIDGISNVEGESFLDEQILIKLNQDKMKSSSMQMSKIRELLTESNVVLNLGAIETAKSRYAVKIIGDAKNLQDNFCVNIDSNGRKVYLKDIASISKNKYSFLEDNHILRFNGKSCLELFVFKREGVDENHLIKEIEPRMSFLTQRGFDYIIMPYRDYYERDDFTIFIQMPTGTKLDVTDKFVKQVEKVVEEYRGSEDVKNYTTKVESHSAEIYVQLPLQEKQKKESSQIIEELRKKTDLIEPAFIYYEQPQEVEDREVIVEFFGNDYKILKKLARETDSYLKGIEELTDVKLRMREGGPCVYINVDEEQCARFRIKSYDVLMQVSEKIGGQHIFKGKQDFHNIFIMQDDKFVKTYDNLDNLIIYNKDGEEVFLKEVAGYTFGLIQPEIWRNNGYRMVQVSVYTPQGKNKDEYIDKIKQEILSKVSFPDGYFFNIR